MYVVRCGNCFFRYFFVWIFVFDYFVIGISGDVGYVDRVVCDFQSCLSQCLVDVYVDFMVVCCVFGQ